MAQSTNAIEWESNSLRLLDQRILPEKVQYLELTSCDSVAQAISDMVVRGAPAIGITAAYGVVLAATKRWQEDPKHWKTDISNDLTNLLHSRPTAVNLAWAVAKMQDQISSCEGDPRSDLLDLAIQIHNDDIRANQHMGELGAALIDSQSGVLTHCNAGALATGGYGTALGVIRSAHHKGKLQAVFADETRPWLQGARLTAWELTRENIPVQLIIEGAAASLMRTGKIAWVIVGADRVASNGDVANKIGTYNLAVLARYHGVKFMVVAPTSTLDLDILGGEQIPIEIRDEQEILSIFDHSVAPVAATAWNPVFDVTPAELVDALVTEKGVVMAPDQHKIAALFDT